MHLLLFILILLFLLILYLHISFGFGVRPYYPRASKLSVFYGAPGSGKSSVACYYALRTLKAGYKVYSNVPINGCCEITKEDIGHFQITDGLVIIDESGIEYNNRDFASNFSKRTDNNASLTWFKKHRHEGCEIMIFSQGFDDTDKKITTLGTDYFIVRKNWLLPICTFRRIRKTPQIDKQTKQPIDAFDYKPFSFRFVYFPRLWSHFDSFDRMDLPSKDFRIYGSGGSASAGQTLPHEASGSADEAIPTGNDAAATSSRIENAETFSDDFQFSFI